MLWRSTIALLLALALQPDGVAQAFPARPIVIVVPYAAGGAPDFVARILAEKLTASLGQPVRVENRPGASGNIAAANVAQSPPDGHTLLIGDNALLTISPFVYRNDSFNAVRDLVPVAALVESIGYWRQPSFTAADRANKVVRQLAHEASSGYEDGAEERQLVLSSGAPAAPIAR